MSDKLIEFLWSSFTTFVAAFCLALAPMIGGVPLDQAAILAAVMVAGRAGVKALMQYLMSGSVGELLKAKGRV